MSSLTLLGGSESSGGGTPSIPGAILSGHDWTWLTNNTLKLAPFGHISPKATCVLVDAATETTYSSIEIESDLTFDRSASAGAGGMDSGSPSNGQFYNIYVIAKAGGADPALISSQSAPGSVTMPADYVLISPRPVWSWYQGGSRIQHFICKDPGIGRSCRYSADQANSIPYALLAGTSTTRANVDLSLAAPSSARSVYIQLRANNSGLTSRDLTIFNSASNGGQILQSVKNIGGASSGDGSSQWSSVVMDLPIRISPSDCLAYAWSGAVTGGLTVDIHGFELG